MSEEIVDELTEEEKDIEMINLKLCNEEYDREYRLLQKKYLKMERGYELSMKELEIQNFSKDKCGRENKALKKDQYEFLEKASFLKDFSLDWKKNSLKSFQRTKGKFQSVYNEVMKSIRKSPHPSPSKLVPEEGVIRDRRDSHHKNIISSKEKKKSSTTAHQKLPFAPLSPKKRNIFRRMKRRKKKKKKTSEEDEESGDDDEVSSEISRDSSLEKHLQICFESFSSMQKLQDRVHSFVEQSIIPKFQYLGRVKDELSYRLHSQNQAMMELSKLNNRLREHMRLYKESFDVSAYQKHDFEDRIVPNLKDEITKLQKSNKMMKEQKEQMEQKNTSLEIHSFVKNCFYNVIDFHERRNYRYYGTHVELQNYVHHFEALESRHLELTHLIEEERQVKGKRMRFLSNENKLLKSELAKSRIIIKKFEDEVKYLNQLANHQKKVIRKVQMANKKRKEQEQKEQQQQEEERERKMNRFGRSGNRNNTQQQQNHSRSGRFSFFKESTNNRKSKQQQQSIILPQQQQLLNGQRNDMKKREQRQQESSSSPSTTKRTIGRRSFVDKKRGKLTASLSMSNVVKSNQNKGKKLLNKKKSFLNIL